ncbi:endonuclease domain-containing protein [Pelagibius sp.]|uniref:endonuclease domain-containing protein n=1 Tax=Pelagibius sp. TaxID=1931238 RepID=UPI0026344DAF|nr:DUF559 domain-containing protein [Pelagibius sp.]
MASRTARQLRSDTTEAEQKLWSVLRRRQLDGLRFRRQVPLGRYIVDFACYSERLIVEVDGGQHADHRPADDRRTAWLESQGFRVVRFWNNDVLSNIEGVTESIRAAASSGAPPLPNPPPPGGRGT